MYLCFIYSIIVSSSLVVDSFVKCAIVLRLECTFISRFVDDSTIDQCILSIIVVQEITVTDIIF